MNDLKLFAKALLAGTHSPEALMAEFGPGLGEDQPVDLTNATPEDLERLHGSKILPTRGVCSYLASDDVLTHSIIDQMERALENDYKLQHPWFITAFRKHKNDNLTVAYFYLEHEEGD